MLFNGVLRHKKLLSFHQSHEECLVKLVDAAFDEMQVKVPVNSEDRSLDSLEEDEKTKTTFLAKNQSIKANTGLEPRVHAI